MYNLKGISPIGIMLKRKDIQVLLFFQSKPLSVTYGLGIEEHDHEGRVITLELESYYLITVYTPNSQEELRRLDYRMKWDDDFPCLFERNWKRKNCNCVVI